MVKSKRILPMIKSLQNSFAGSLIDTKRRASFEGDAQSETFRNSIKNAIN